MGFGELRQRIAEFEALFQRGDFAPLMETGIIALNFQQIKVCATELERFTTQDHVKFLLCRTIETAILNIQKYTDGERHRPQIQAFIQTSEFAELSQTQAFLTQQQQIWYLSYLLQELRDIFNKSEPNATLLKRIEDIYNNPNLDFKAKTQQIDLAIHSFAKANVMTFVGDKSKPLKMALLDKMDAERPTITRLSDSPSLNLELKSAP